tara:strand:- start:882 stop:1157 length:276 start_codon:yes stop_codon:yes gene_type:complete
MKMKSSMRKRKLTDCVIFLGSYLDHRNINGPIEELTDYQVENRASCARMNYYYAQGKRWKNAKKEKRKRNEKSLWWCARKIRVHFSLAVKR